MAKHHTSSCLTRNQILIDLEFLDACVMHTDGPEIKTSLVIVAENVSLLVTHMARKHGIYMTWIHKIFSLVET